MKYLKDILTGVFMVCMCVCLSINHSSAAEWKLHPSFDRTPQRIIDTPDYTYFLVHQQIYNKTYVGYDFSSLTLFEYNKSRPESGITPLVHEIQLTSADLRLADYSPAGNYLLIAYNDGGIDLIGKDRSLVHVDKLKKSTMPGMSVINSVTFNPATGDAWIATDAGYMVIDANTFMVKETSALGSAIQYINKFEDGLVALSGSAIYQTDKGRPVSFEDFTKISEISAASILLPMADSGFVYVDGTPGATRNLKSAIRNGDSWTITQLGSDNFYTHAVNESFLNRYESNFIPNKDGYICYSTSKAWQIKKDETGLIKAISISLNANPLTLGSWDFTNFWAYRDRGTFIPMTANYAHTSGAVNASATWTETSAPIRPNAPAAFICTYMSYSPTYGMLVINHGNEWTMVNNSIVNPSLLSAYNKEWNILSQAYYKPYSVVNDKSLENKYNQYINRFPIPDPNGLLIDSENENWIVTGSMFGGVMFQDISDIKNDVIRYCAVNDVLIDYPGVVGLTEKPTWGTLSCMSPPSVDSYGNIWVLHPNRFTTTESENPGQLLYITPQRREEIFKAPKSTLNSVDNWEKIMLPYKEDFIWTCRLTALKNIKNKNIILYSGANSGNPIVAYNHRGTLDDLSDDSYQIIKGIRTKTGELVNFGILVDIVEDPNNGDIYVVENDHDIACFKMNDEITDDGYIKGWIFNDIINKERISIPKGMQINKIIIDSENRIWIATNNFGVIGISADRDIFAHYSVKNSQLMSDQTFGLCWNPNDRSLIISTKLGLCQVYPDLTTHSIVKSTISIMPKHIQPSYNGNVIISGLPGITRILIKDKDGNIVKSINTRNYNLIEWDLKDNKGNRVDPGIYYIHTVNCAPVEIFVF